MPTETQVLAVDIYGTILDTSAMGAKIMEVQPSVTGSFADELCVTWRKYQLEYTWRLNSMGLYKPFDAVTKGALQHAIAEHDAHFLDTHVEYLMRSYNELQPFPGARSTLEAISKMPNVKVVIFSNGTREMVTTALDSAALTDYMDGLFVVEPVKMYKPAKKVYEGLVDYINSENGGLAGVSVTPEQVWLVSGNPFDVTGARNFGLNAIWVSHSASHGWVDRAVDLKPSRIVGELGEIVHLLEENALRQ